LTKPQTDSMQRSPERLYTSPANTMPGRTGRASANGRDPQTIGCCAGLPKQGDRIPPGPVTVEKGPPSLEPSPSRQMTTSLAACFAWTELEYSSIAFYRVICIRLVLCLVVPHGSPHFSHVGTAAGMRSAEEVAVRCRLPLPGYCLPVPEAMRRAQCAHEA
jgi:hypothetical protein